MADDNQVLRKVNWQEVFSFSHIFKSFKMAVHPSKLVLCTLALLLLFLTGVVLDLLWSAAGSYAPPGSIDVYARRPAVYDQRMEQWERTEQRNEALRRLAAMEEQFVQLSGFQGELNKGPSTYLTSRFGETLREYNRNQQPAPTARTAEQIREAYKDESVSEVLGDAEDKLDDTVEKIRDLLESAEERAEDAIAKESIPEERKEELQEQLDLHSTLARRALAQWKFEQQQQIDAVRGDTIAEAFLDYEWTYLRRAIFSVAYGNFTGGLARHEQILGSREPAPIARADNFQAPVVGGQDQEGFLFSVLMMGRGVAWLVTEHWLYALVYLLTALAIIALLGGAVHRIAALQFAREEKISMVQALRFSGGKFFSFFSAPLIPIGLILVLGLLITLGSLLVNIPVVDILMSILLFLALLLGLAIAFLTIGLVAGFPLMYPTIAAEGSDSFDAISRSFSYVFTRPWRTLLYGLVAVVYGVLTYLFVRLFAYLALAATHMFMSWGVFVGGDTLGPNADKLDVLWTAPTYWNLSGPFSWAAMDSWYERVAAMFIWLWTFLVATVVFAYLLSFAASASNVIYFLLRRKVDATDLDDVYVEEPEEEPLAPAGESAPPAEPAAPSEPAAPVLPPASPETAQPPAGDAAPEGDQPPPPSGTEGGEETQQNP